MERLELVQQTREDLKTGSDAAPIQCRGCVYGEYAASTGERPPYAQCPRIKDDRGNPFVCGRLSSPHNLIWKNREV